MFSKGILELTWWPLFRDCSFYIVSIILLMIFFVDGQIMWYEGLLLKLICLLNLKLEFKNLIIENSFVS